MKKLLLLTAVFFAFMLPAFSETQMTQQEQDLKLNEQELKLIDKFWNLRMELTCLSDNEEAVRTLDSFKLQNQSQVNLLGEQASILLDALIIMERYNYLNFFPGEDKSTRKQFYDMKVKIKAFMDSKNYKNISPYLYLCYADITSYYMAYSITDILFNGMSVKKNQEQAIKAGSEFSPAMLNLSQWYYYAPGIFGGSKEATREWLLKSIQYARTKAELFYAKSSYSQFLFETGETEESKKQLEECAELCPGSTYIKLLQEQNALGKSLNDYNKEKSKLLKSADDYRKKNNIKD